MLKFAYELDTGPFGEVPPCLAYALGRAKHPKVASVPNVHDECNFVHLADDCRFPRVALTPT